MVCRLKLLETAQRYRSRACHATQASRFPEFRDTDYPYLWRPGNRL